MNIANNIAVYSFTGDEPITLCQKRRLHDLVFQRFDDYATINQCLSYVEGLNRSEVEEYVNGFDL